RPSLSDLMCSEPVLQSVMAGSLALARPARRSSKSRQSIDTLDVGRRKPADSMVWTAAVGKRADDCDLVRQRRVRKRDGNTVIVRADVKRVLVRKRNVDGRARRGALCERGNPRLAAASRLAHHVAEHRREHGHAMLLLAVNAYDGGLAIALRL